MKKILIFSLLLCMCARKTQTDSGRVKVIEEAEISRDGSQYDFMIVCDTYTKEELYLDQHGSITPTNRVCGCEHPPNINTKDFDCDRELDIQRYREKKCQYKE